MREDSEGRSAAFGRRSKTAAALLELDLGRRGILRSCENSIPSQRALFLISIRLSICLSVCAAISLSTCLVYLLKAL